MSIEKCKDFEKDGYGTWDDSSRPTTFANFYDYTDNQNKTMLNLVSILWQPSTDYVVGQVVHSPSLPAGCKATCTTAGTSGSTEPGWTAYGTSITDGTVKWKIETDVQSTLMAEVTDAINQKIASGTGSGSGSIDLSIYAKKADLASYASLASPVLTGIPKAPTANAGTNTTQIATTAFVNAAINEVNTQQADWAVTDSTQKSFIRNKPQTWSTLNLKKPDYTNSIVDPTTRPLVDFLRGNRLAFLPADQIIIEQTVDGGATWTDAGISDDKKEGLFSEIRSSAVAIPQIDGNESAKCGIRITITAMKYDVPNGTAETDKYKYWNSKYVKSAERYCSLSEFVFWDIAASNRIKVTIESASGRDADNWKTRFSDNSFGLTGEAGANYVQISDALFGGGLGQTDNYWNYRFTFLTSSNNLDDNITLRPTVKQGIINILGYGINIWTIPNSLAFNDHLYSWDKDENAVFPAGLNAATLMQGGKNLDDIIKSAIKAALATATVSDGKIIYNG